MSERRPLCDLSIMGRDDDGERFTVGPLRCRVDGTYAPAARKRQKLVSDWAGFWPHMALVTDHLYVHRPTDQGEERTDDA